MTLELFEQVKNPTAEADAMREEIAAALPVLEELQQSSSIADRGIRLVLPLLEEEKRQRELAKKRTRKVRLRNTFARPTAMFGTGLTHLDSRVRAISRNRPLRHLLVQQRCPGLTLPRT